MNHSHHHGLPGRQVANLEAIPRILPHRLPAPRWRLQPVFAARCPGPAVRSPSVAWAVCIQEAIVQPDLYRLPLAPRALLPIASTLLLAISLSSKLQLMLLQFRIILRHRTTHNPDYQRH